MLQSENINTTILRHDTKLETLEVDIASNIEKRDEDITNLKKESDQLHKTVLRHGVMLSSFNGSLFDVGASVEELIDNSHRYKGIYYHI